jgi:hypothetical protein
MFQSCETTRYYLCGVFVEPCAIGGVTLTATDGHRLICIRDETGQADRSGIVAISKESLKTCKLGKHESARRITIVDQDATIEKSVTDGNWQAVAFSPKCFVDGTFPEYRRVVPTANVMDSTKGPQSFHGARLATFAKAASELEDDSYGKGILSCCAADCNSPALVLFAASPHAFGVLMPERGVTATVPPAWFFGAMDKTKAV